MPRLAGAWYRARVELRSRLGSVLFLALLVTLIVGGIMGVAVGDRRNATAYDRLIKAGGGPDLFVLPGQSDADDGNRVDVEKVRALAGVKRASSIAGFVAVPGDADLEAPPSWTFEVVGPTDDDLLRTTMRPIVVRGGLAMPNRADEAVVNEEFARREHLNAGEHISIRVFMSASDKKPARFVFRVTGIVRFPDEVVQSDSARQSLLMTSRAFVEAHPRSVAYHLVAVDLRNSETETARVRRSISALVSSTPPGYATMINRRSTMRLATCAVNSTMIVFSIVFGLLGLIVIGQTLSRMQRGRLRNSEVLAALGAPPSTRVAIALAVPVAGTSIGLVGAALFSVLLSPLFPVGVARRAEVSPGFAVNLAWTLGGLAVAAIALGLLIGAVTWLVIAVPRHGHRVVRSSRVVNAMRRLGLPLSVVYGTRRALAPSGGHASTRRGMVGVALAVAGIVLAIVFTANIRAVVNEPGRFGWSWDELVKLDATPSSPVVQHSLAKLSADPSVDGVGAFSPLPVLVNGFGYPALSIVESGRPLPVELVKGRAPSGREEVALGGRTMHRLHVEVGDRVVLGAPGTDRTVGVTVVGEVVLPPASVVASSDSTSLGYGVYAPASTISRVSEMPQTGVAVHFRPDADAGARNAALAMFDPLIRKSAAMRVHGVQRPDNIVALDQIGLLPTALAVSLGLLVVVGLGLTLISSTRSRRRDLAVLKSMGFVRSQLVGIVMWEATVTSLLAAVIGAVVGTALGRFAWLVMTGDLALAPTIVTPVAAVLLAVISAVLVANVVALIPAQVAARTPVSTILKNE